MEFREYWKRNYGPTIAVYKFNDDQPDRVAALDRDFLSFLTEWNQVDGAGQDRLSRGVPARHRDQEWPVAQGTW